tara:strand:- start:56 stop:550 length:495 start_codon:yes stop_codon:yes gene_type:complete
MKSFDEFKKDLSEMDRTLTGPGLFGAGIRTVANVAAGPLKKATKVANIFRSSRDERIDKAKDKLLDTVFGTPKDVQKQLDEPQKPKLAPGEKGIKDLADKALDRNPVAKNQMKDARENAPKDKKIKNAVDTTEKGTIERYKALKKAWRGDDNVVPIRKPKPKNP